MRTEDRVSFVGRFSTCGRMRAFPKNIFPEHSGGSSFYLPCARSMGNSRYFRTCPSLVSQATNAVHQDSLLVCTDYHIPYWSLTDTASPTSTLWEHPFCLIAFARVSLFFLAIPNENTEFLADRVRRGLLLRRVQNKLFHSAAQRG